MTTYWKGVYFDGRSLRSGPGNPVLHAPCKWCGYDGEGYWQARTHAESCPWHGLGGAEDRAAALFEGTRFGAYEPPSDRRSLARAIRDCARLLEREFPGEPGLPTVQMEHWARKLEEQR